MGFYEIFRRLQIVVKLCLNFVTGVLKNSRLPERDAVSSDGWLSRFRRFEVPPSAGLSSPIRVTSETTKYHIVTKLQCHSFTALRWNDVTESDTVSQFYSVTVTQRQRYSETMSQRVTQCHSFTASQWHNDSVTVKRCHSDTVSQFYSVTVTQWHSVTVKRCHRVTQCHNITVSQFYSVTVTMTQRYSETMSEL